MKSCAFPNYCGSTREIEMLWDKAILYVPDKAMASKDGTEFGVQDFAFNDHW